MKLITNRVIGAAALLIAYATQAQLTQIGESEPIPRDQLPTSGTFWFAKGPTGRGCPPLPFPPGDPDLPVYALPNSGQYLVDDSSVVYPGVNPVQTRSLATYSSIQPPPIPGGGGGSGNPPPPPPNIPNYQKFMGQQFSVIDTNDAAVNDLNLYHACISFPPDNHTGGTLQIVRYTANSVIIKASHFDYSAETRDLALLICDRVETPIWKTLALNGSPDSRDGWLIQGFVPNWMVTDPMFMAVSNVNLLYNGFFRAIPYSGPQVTITGAQSNSTVSGTITLSVTATDLSGVSSEQCGITVNGLPARYNPTSSNTFSIDTRYAPNGIQELEVAVGNQTALAADPSNPPSDTKTSYSTAATLPLDFENNIYLASASEMCSPIVGTNYILFAVTAAQQIQARITDPSNGQIVASYGGYVPYPAIVEIPWNFTEADGSTPYSNDTYAVSFTASGPTTLRITNTVDRNGVRTAAGCILTYEEEDPSLSAGSYLNTEAAKWIGALAGGLYSALYSWDWASLTQYSPSDIGANRDNPSWTSFPLVLTRGNETAWGYQTCVSLTNLAFSDFGYYAGHGSGVGIGGGGHGSSFVTVYLDSGTVKGAVHAGPAGPNWRMRKVALWACYTDTPYWTTAEGTYPTWAAAFGIRSTSLQRSSWMMKNVGLFFTGELPQGGYSGTLGGTAAEVASMLDDLWVAGPSPFSGLADPTYAFSWAVTQIRGMCPQINNGLPNWVGFGYLPYTGIYDANLVTNDVSHIKR